MAITDPLILSPDVLFIPVAELAEDVRGRFTHAAGDVALTHPRARTPSRVLDARSAELVEQFRAARTIVEAVIRFSRAHGADPEATLEEAYPLLQRLLESGFLVEAGSPEAAGILPALRPGEEIGGFTVVELVRGLEDTELYAARGAAGEWAALKVARPSAAAAVGDLFAREAAVLRHLDGDGAPRLLAAGELDTLAGGRPWLAIEWIAGVDAETAARELRAAARADLLDLLRRIADVYVRLHARGVLHGDVHPHNLLVERSGAVRLLDFGYARWDGGPAALLPPRAGVVFYHEPEQAAALRSGTPLPAATPAGEQYAVAALLYQLAAGAHRRDYSLEKDEMLRQVAEEPPLPFSARGIEPWPRLEAVLARALGRAPEERFPSLADFAAALAAAAPETGLAAAWGRPAGEAELDAVLARALERVGEGGAAFTAGLPPPTASVNYGAAGVACALHRMAQAREDAPLLALADLWAERAAAAAGAPGAWHSAEIGVTRETVGESSAYHSAAGVHAVRAAIAHALGLPGLQEPAVGAFLAAAAVPGPEVDLTLGRSGLLLAGALLAGTLAPEASRRRELLAWGEALQRVLWAELDALPPLAGDSHSLGIAHGWAGYLYAALRWSRAAGTPLPAGAAGRLAELAAEAVPAGRGRRWAWRGAGQGLSMPGWCNGSAGLVFLWTLAAESLGGLSGGPDYAALAAGAAWNAWEAPDGHANLCCGLAGRAYALLDLWRHGGGAEWLSRARVLAGRAARAAARSSEPPDSLYKGALGVAVLAADLARPEGAAMPFFGDEGW